MSGRRTSIFGGDAVRSCAGKEAAMSSSTTYLKSSGLALGYIQPVLNFVDTLLRIRRNRAAILQLADADEHMLRDIGITRAEVRAAYHSSPLTDPGRIVRVFSDLR
jgi:uncharacterized protein YjiS (DUF1127 family)